MADIATVYLVNPRDDSLQILDEPLWYPDPLVRYGVAGIDYTGGDLLDPDEIYRTQRSVRMVVNFIAKSFAQVQLHAFTTDDKGDRTRLSDPADKLVRLLKSPDQVHTGYEFNLERSKDLALWERYAALKVSQPDGSVKLVRLPPKLWRFKRNKRDEPIGVVVANEVVELERFLWMDGYPAAERSPMAHLAELLVEERESAKHRVNLWAHGAQIDGVISRPVDAPEWTPTERERWRAGWIAAYTGRGASRAGGTPLLEDGMVYTPAKGFTSRELQQIEARKLATSEVAAAFGIAPQLVGVTGDANYSNVIAYRQMLYDDTLGPLFMQDSQAWNLRMVPDVNAGAFVEHNVAEKLRLSFEEQAEVLSTAIGGPWLTRAEGRRRQNLPYIEGSDLLIEPLNVGVLNPDGSSASDDADDLTLAEKLQKVYLAVGVVITRDEARGILGLAPSNPADFPTDPPGGETA